jgi:hypothetical protein
MGIRPDYLPTSREVGAMLRTRTRLPGGQELGFFTNDTRPTDAEVDLLVAQAYEDLISRTQADIPEVLIGQFRQTLILATALRIELSYFPEQIATNRSPYDQYKTLYDEQWRVLTEALNDVADGGLQADGEGLGSGYPSYGGFPLTGIGMEFDW